MAEQERIALISTFVSIIRCEGIPSDVRQAALTLIGWLARRMGDETPCPKGVVEARKQMIRLTSR